MKPRPFLHRGGAARNWRPRPPAEEAFEPYESRLRRGLWCPPRLRGRRAETVDEVNDWYFAMLRDSQRNDFFWRSLESCVKGKRVVDVGAGCGLLSLMAARLGAESVLAIEASREMCALAKLNLQRNGHARNVEVVNGWSCDVALPDDKRADVIVSETLGTLLLGECAHLHLSDARKRLALPDAVVLPTRGVQCAALVSSPSLAALSRAPDGGDCHGFDLSAVNALQDTAGVYFTKDRGVRLNGLPDLRPLSPRLPLFSVDFGFTEPEDLARSRSVEFEALESGVAHAVIASWDVDGPGGLLSTDYEVTREQSWGFYRDMQWGQGIQLIEDHDAAPRRAVGKAAPPPVPFEVTKGEKLSLTVRLSEPDRMSMQFRLRRSSARQR